MYARDQSLIYPSPPITSLYFTSLYPLNVAASGESLGVNASLIAPRLPSTTRLAEIGIGWPPLAPNFTRAFLNRKVLVVDKYIRPPSLLSTSLSFFLNNNLHQPFHHLPTSLFPRPTRNTFLPRSYLSLVFPTRHFTVTSFWSSERQTRSDLCSLPPVTVSTCSREVQRVQLFDRSTWYSWSSVS